MTREQKLETKAWDCETWPDWLHDIVEKTNEVADRLDMSAEQAHAYAVLSALSALSAPKAEAEEPCPVCAKPFADGDTCATDIELGKCHAECLAGSPTVDLGTGEPVAGPIDTFPHAATKAEAAEPYGYVYEERTPPRFTFSKTRIAIRPEDANEYELSETPVYTSPVPALTDDQSFEISARIQELRRRDLRRSLLAAFPSKGEGQP